MVTNSSRLRVALLVGASLLLALVFQWERLFGVGPSGWDRVVPAGDALQFAERWEAARVSLFEFHQFPSWNPWQCGGVSLFGDAEAPFPGPLFFLSFLGVPTPIAMNVWLVLHLAIAVFGMAVLVRQAGGNRPEQLLAGAIVAGSSFFAHHFLWEHLSFAPFCFVPWILWAHRRSLQEPRWAVLTGILFALSVLEGGANPTPMMAVVIGFDALLRLPDAAERAALGRTLPVAAGVAALLAAPRLIAIWSVLRHGRASQGGGDGLSLGELLDAWTRSGAPESFAHPLGWDEYSAYVGLLPLGLALVGLLILSLEREPRTDVVLFLLLCWLAMGSSPAVSLHGVLSHLPVYRELRVPSRYLFPATVLLALIAARTLVWIRDRLGRRQLFIAAEWLALVFVIFDLTAAGSEVVQSARVGANVETAVPRQPAALSVMHTAGPSMPLAAGPVLGQGVKDCYHPQYPVMAAPALRTGDVAQQWLVPETSGTLSMVSWTPNEIRFTARLEVPATVVVNQNDNEDWHVSTGTKTTMDGLLAVELPAGQHELRVWNRPPLFAFAWLCCLLGLGLSIWWWRRPAH